MLKNIGRHLKNCKKDWEKLQKYQYITYGLDYLFNELNEEDYYKPTKVKSAFDGGYIKNKGVTINPRNTKNDMCFQYAITTALNHQNIDHHAERISKLRPFINNYNFFLPIMVA